MILPADFKEPGVLKARDAIFAGAFVAAIFLTLIATLLASARDKKRVEEFSKSVSEGQSRLMNSPLRPIVVGVRATRLFVRDFNDWCILREPFIRWNGIAKVKWLRSSTSPDIVLGKQNWLFHNNNQSLDDFRHMAPFPPRKIARLKNFFEGHNGKLTQRGIRFLVIIPPNKQTIYPEFMPDALAPAKGQTRLDQFLSAMKNSPVSILDLRPVLREAKTNLGPVFLRDDSHWNDRGAFAAYTATAMTLKKWFPAVRPTPLSKFKAYDAQRSNADLPDMMGIPGDITENIVRLKPIDGRAFPARIAIENYDRQYMREARTRSPRGEVGRVLVFGDSFAFLTLYMPLLSRHFREAHWCWLSRNTNIKEELIKSFKPDLVILERVERITFEIPQTPDAKRDSP